VEIRGSVIVITGASSGIGACAARHLAQLGAKVALAARRLADIHALAAEIAASGGEAIAVQTDVGDASDVRRLMRETVARYGRIDALVNNAGIGGGLLLTATPDAMLEAVLKVNMLGAALCAKYAVPHMQRGGVIVNVGSIAGEVGTFGMYTASKFGLRGFNDALRRELKNAGIAVTLVAPGFIHTPMTDGLKFYMPGPDVVARAIARMLRRPRRRCITPWYYWPLITVGKIAWLSDLIFSRRFVQDMYRDRESVKKILGP
jgi:NAD(P)-dependent dehydrogenase (short-subunit alcohol dehydrogenase family)